MVCGAFVIIPYRVALARYEQFTSDGDGLLHARRKPPRARARVQPRRRDCQMKKAARPGSLLVCLNMQQRVARLVYIERATQHGSAPVNLDACLAVHVGDADVQLLGGVAGFLHFQW